MLLASFAMSGCDFEQATQVAVSGDSKPAFALSGSGTLGAFTIYIVSPDDYKLGRTMNDFSLDSFFTQPAVWRIQAQAGYLQGNALRKIRRINYGVIPSGYKQTIPADGSAPQAILAGRDYFFDCDTVNAPGSRGSFQLQNNKMVATKIQLPCQEMQGGKETTVRCPKND